MASIFKTKSSFTNTLVACANACLISLSLLLSLNFVSKFSVVINNGHIASTMLDNPTAKMLNGEMPLSVQLDKEPPSIQSHIFKTFIPSKVNNKKVVFASLPGNLQRKISHEKWLEKKLAMQALPPEENGKIDGAEKVFALAFTFNGHKIDQVSWANKFVPIDTDSTNLVAASVAPIGPVVEKMDNSKRPDLIDHVSLVQSSSAAASVSDEHILSIQNEIQQTITAQDNESISDNRYLSDSEADVESELKQDDFNENTQHYPFADQSISKTIGDAIERETQRMGGGISSGLSNVGAGAKKNVSIQGRMSKQNMAIQQVNTQKKKRVQNIQESPNALPNQNGRSPGIVNEDETSSLLNEVRKQGEVVAQDNVVKLTGFEITRSGQLKMKITENVLSMASNFTNDSIEYQAEQVLLSGIEKGSSFDLKIVDEKYIESIQEVSTGEQKNEKFVYFIKRELFNEMLDELQVDPGLGHLLLTNDQIDVVEIDSKEEISSVIYLDSSLRETDDKLFTYVLISTRPGNIVANLGFKTGEYRRKIFHLYGGEVRIDSMDLLERNETGINLYTQRIMGSRTDYNVSTTVFTDFQNSLPLIRRGPNHIEYIVGKVLGGRSFIEVEEENDRFYIGTQFDTNLVVLPSQDFRNEVLKIFEAETIGKSCIIQVNLDQKVEKVEEVEVTSETGSGPISFEAMYLDKDGSFGSSVTTETTTMFIKGEDVGAFEIYFQTSNAVKVMRTYCSHSSYLVEQL